MRASRSVRALFGALLVTGGLVTVTAPAGASTAMVSTEAELRAALADGATTAVTLENSIDLVDCSAAGGDLDRSGTLTLDGAGFTVRQTCVGERVLESAAGTLTLQDVTITGGDQSGSGDVLGGGVRAAGDLALIDTTITGNTVTGTSAYGGGVEADGSISITSSHVDGNEASGAAGAFGAGVMGGADENITITDSSVDGNTATLPVANHPNAGVLGGGISLLSGTSLDITATATSGTVQLVRSSVNDNVAAPSATLYAFAFGGGVYADTVTLDHSHVDRNELRPTSTSETAVGAGAGAVGETSVIADHSSLDANVIQPHGPFESAKGGASATDAGSITLTDSSASDNALVPSGTATGGNAHGGAFATPSVTLTRATVSGNHVTSTGVAYAGGLVTDDLTAQSSTMAGNTVTSTAGDAYAGSAKVGGGTIESTTLSGNTATGVTAHGGGIVHDRYNVASTPLALVDSTLSSNRAVAAESTAGGMEQADDASGLSLVFTTLAGNDAVTGANLAQSTSGASAEAAGTVAVTASVVADPLGGGTNCAEISLAGGTDAYVTDASCDTAVSSDPQLGALADNGGPTQTMLPSIASPVLDRVPAGACLTLVTVDQRDVTRPQGPACDIGAVEREATSGPPPDPTSGPTTRPAAVAGPVAAPAVVAEPRFTG